MPNNPFQWGANNPNMGANLNAGIQAATGLMSAINPPQYNPRIGMSKPSMLNSMSDFSLMGMGSALGPAGMAIGGGLDVVKNLVAYNKQKQQYNRGEAKADVYDERANRLATLQPDYTQAAKYGMQVKNPYKFGGGVMFGDYPNSYAFGGMNQQMQPVTMENNELVVMPQADGTYQPYMQTAPNAPTHEQGGVNTQLPQGALVFPQQYIPQVQAAMQNQDWAQMEQLKQQMLQGSQQAAQQGLPFSNPQAGVMGDGGEVKGDPRAMALQQSIMAEDEEPEPAQNTRIMTGAQGTIDTGERGDIEASKIDSKTLTAINDIIDAQKADYNAAKKGITPIRQDATREQLEKARMALWNSDDAGVQTYFGANKQTLLNSIESKISEHVSKGQPKVHTKGDEPEVVHNAAEEKAESKIQTKYPKVGMDERTRTRHEHMKAGTYWKTDASGKKVAATYWDEKTQTRKPIDGKVAKPVTTAKPTTTKTAPKPPMRNGKPDYSDVSYMKKVREYKGTDIKDFDELEDKHNAEEERAEQTKAGEVGANALNKGMNQQSKQGQSALDKLAGKKAEVKNPYSGNPFNRPVVKEKMDETRNLQKDNYVILKDDNPTYFNKLVKEGYKAMKNGNGSQYVIVPKKEHLSKGTQGMKVEKKSYTDVDRQKTIDEFNAGKYYINDEIRMATQKGEESRAKHLKDLKAAYYKKMGFTEETKETGETTKQDNPMKHGGQVINPYRNGGSIHIKPSHEGRFTEWATRHGMSVSEAADHVMANTDKYDPSVVKMANFAKNARSFKH